MSVDLSASTSSGDSTCQERSEQSPRSSTPSSSHKKPRSMWTDADSYRESDDPFGEPFPIYRSSEPAEGLAGGHVVHEAYTSCKVYDDDDEHEFETTPAYRSMGASGLDSGPLGGSAQAPGEWPGPPSSPTFRSAAACNGGLVAAAPAGDAGPPSKQQGRQQHQQPQRRRRQQQRKQQPTLSAVQEAVAALGRLIEAAAPTRPGADDPAISVQLDLLAELLHASVGVVKRAS